MRNIKTMKAVASALLIFGCFIATLILTVFFLSEDKSETVSTKAQQIIYQSIGELAGYSNSEIPLTKTINTLSDNIDNPDIELIVRCYTNNNATAFRDHLKAINYANGQFCKVQQNLEVTSKATQNNSDRCAMPQSMIIKAEQLEKLGRKYTGDFASDIASCRF